MTRSHGPSLSIFSSVNQTKFKITDFELIELGNKKEICGGKYEKRMKPL